FDPDALKENFLSLMAALCKSKPASSKGVFIKKVTLSTTMGPGVRLDVSGL
ncbi:MAG: 50S ribosomal protein L1, partial [Pseudomonadota bacterium]